MTRDVYQHVLSQVGKRKTETEETRKAVKKAPDHSAHASLTQALSQRPCRVTRHAPNSRKTQVRGYLTWVLSEPPSGFEPETYALRVRCSGHLS